MLLIYTLIPVSCLVAAIIAGLGGHIIGRTATHRVAITGVGLSFVLSMYVLFDVLQGNYFDGMLYTWGTSGSLTFQIGFLIDELSAAMAVVVTFVSLMVHIYTIGYMQEDPGYQRFFCYIALFTFAMLMLVMANNFLQLFFGWEGVGVVSYLLIGFWFDRDSAIYANMKAFLVNRVGDFGFILAIAAIVYVFGSLNYAEVFEQAPAIANMTVEAFEGVNWHWLTIISLLLFVGAMGKSAQVPLHVWLPDSMEGPTPISALIHAATMVTAGIFMVARMSPLFEFSEVALTVVITIGSITALFMALIGLVQNDIKRIVAYSTLSQLGYMTVALGASAYAAGMFHLTTHAFFKALLFLAAGSVIVALHHQQDIRRMGGLRKIMPITYWTALVGSLALAGLPPFSGFFSKDTIIEAVHASHLPGSGFALFAVTVGVFITALYSFRMLFIVFHGTARMSADELAHASESPWVITLPLVVLAVPSVIFGAIYAAPMLYGSFYDQSIFVAAEHDTLARVASGLMGSDGTVSAWKMFIHGFVTLPFWLAVAGIVTAWVLYIRKPEWPAVIQSRFNMLWQILDRKYGFDEFNEIVFAGGTRNLGSLLWKVMDMYVIDGVVVNGLANSVKRISSRIRTVQSGFVYHYAFTMIIGLLLLITWYMVG